VEGIWVNEFILAIAKSYWENHFPNLPFLAETILQKERLDIRQNSAGAYVDLPRCEELKVPRTVPRLWSDLSAIVNDGTTFLIVIVFVEDGAVTTIELAAPQDDCPDLVKNWKFEVDRRVN
jgi:hypothetical protein